jgi:hypothetical protein
VAFQEETMSIAIIFLSCNTERIEMVRILSSVSIPAQEDGVPALMVEGVSVFRDRFECEGLSALNGGVKMSSVAPDLRPALLTTPAAGEIRAGNPADDTGFLRFSAGGGADGTKQSWIDLSGASNLVDLDGVISLGTLGTERLRASGTGVSISGLLTAGNGTFSSSAVDANTLTIQNTSAAATSSSQLSFRSDNVAGGLDVWLNSTTRTADGPSNGATVRNDVGQLRLGVNYGGTSNYLTLSNAATTFDKAVTANAGVVSTSKTTGTVVIAGAGGLGVGGNVYAANMYIGVDPVATQAFVTGKGYITTTAANAAFDPLTTIGAGLTRTGGNVLSVNAAQPGVTSLGTLTGLSLSGPVSSTSTFAVNNATASTSTTTGAVVIAGTGGLGVGGNVYAANMYIGVDPVATQAFVTGRGYITTTAANAAFDPLTTIGAGLTRTGGNVLSVNAAQPGITSVGTLSGLSLSGPVSSTSTLAVNNATASTSTSTGAVVIAGTGGLGVGGNVYAANMYIGVDPVATQTFVTTQGYITTTAANAAFDPLTTIGAGLTRTGGVLSVNAAQSGVTSLGTLTGLTVSGTLSVGTDVNIGGTLVCNGTDGSTLWTFNTERPWLFMQRGTGSAANLTLKTTTAGKRFRIENSDNSTFVDFNMNAGSTGFTTTFNCGIIVTATTASSSVTTGAVQIAGGAGVQGTLYAGNMFIGPDAVATQAYVTGRGYITSSALTPYLTSTLAANTYQPTLSTSPGLKISANTLSIDAAQPGITSLGTLTGLTCSGNVTITNTTASTSTSTGALTIAGTGGLGVGGNVYAANMYIGVNPVATQAWVTQGFAPATGSSIYATQAALNSAAQTQITSVGTLTGLTVSGKLSVTNTTASTSTSTGALTIAGAGGLGVGGNVYAANMYIGVDAVATQTWVNTTKQNTISSGTPITMAALTATSGTFSGAIAVTNTTASTSTSTGALTIAGTGGLGVGGNVYAANMYIGVNPVATQTWVTQGFAPATGSPTYATQVALNSAAQTQITSVGTLTGLTVSGKLSVTNTTASTSTSTGALTIAGTGGLGVGGNVYAANMYIGVDAVATQTWVNTTKQSTISSGTPITMAALTATSGTFSGAIAVTNTTASTSTSTGALTIAGTGGLGVGGNVYATNMYIGSSVVATQAWVNTGLATKQNTINNTVDITMRALTATTGTFSGAITSAGEITAYSDARLKQNVRPITDATTLLRQLQGVRFEWKNGGKASVGLIAQEVQKVLPEIVRENEGVTGSAPGQPILSVAYGNLVALLIEALKVVLDRLDAAETRPTRDTTHRFSVTTTNRKALITLPEWFGQCNEDVQVFLNARDSFGRAYAKVSADRNVVEIFSDSDALFDVLVVGRTKSFGLENRWDE